MAFQSRQHQLAFVQQFSFALRGAGPVETDIREHPGQATGQNVGRQSCAHSPAHGDTDQESAENQDGGSTDEWRRFSLLRLLSHEKRSRLEQLEGPRRDAPPRNV